MFCNIFLFELIVCKFNYSSFLFIILFPKCQVIVQCQALYFSAKNCYLFHIFMAVYIASDKFPCWGQSKANTNVFSGFQLSAASLWHVFTPRKLAARRRSSSRKLANTSQTPQLSWAHILARIISNLSSAKLRFKMLTHAVFHISPQTFCRNVASNTLQFGWALLRSCTHLVNIKNLRG